MQKDSSVDTRCDGCGKLTSIFKTVTHPGAGRFCEKCEEVWRQGGI
jgi:hypothetical protein